MSLQIIETLVRLDQNSTAKGSRARERFERLANDLDLVARGLRQACLVEHYWPWTSMQQHKKIVNALRSVRKFAPQSAISEIADPRFNRVVLLWAELADQVLFLNANVFRTEYNSPSPPWTNFLEIQSPLFFHNKLESVGVALAWIYDTCRLDLNVTDSSRPLPETVVLPFSSVETLVPLAGVLLEYPVAFVPPSSATTTSYFSGETLDFFDVTLRGPALNSPSALESRSLIMFSCPTSAYTSPPPDEPGVSITRSTLIDQIKGRWTERLRSNDLSGEFQKLEVVDVSVHSRKVDGIAL